MSIFIKRIETYLGDLDNWKYAGGDKKQHNNYFNLIFKDKEIERPEKVSKCLCNHDIVENCYIYNEKLNKLVVLGNCCIKRFFKKSGRTCEICGESHQNRKDNKCSDCRMFWCKECGIEKNDNKYKLCTKCAGYDIDTAKDKNNYLFYPDERENFSSKENNSITIYPTMSTFKNLKEFIEHKGLMNSELNQTIEEYYELKRNEETKEMPELTEDFIMTFGKFKGRSIKDIVRKESNYKNYFNWLASESNMFKNNRNASLANLLKSYC